MASSKDTPPTRSEGLGRSVRIAAATLFTILILGLAWPHFSGDVFIHLVKTLDGAAAVLAFGAFILVNTVRTLRFRLTGAKIEAARLFSISALHAAFLRIMPLRSGELAYGLLVKKMGGGGFAEAMAGLVLIRILDLAAVLPLAAIVGFELLLEHRSIPFLAAIGLAGLFLVVAFFGLGPVLIKISEKLSGLSPKTSFSKGLVRGVSVFAKTARLPNSKKALLVGLTLIHWALLIFWFNLCLAAVGVTSHVFEGFVPSVLGITGSILPISLVGSFGPMESGIALGVVGLGKSSEFAASSALLVSALTFACNWALALLAWLFIAAKRINRESPSTEFPETKATRTFGEPMRGAVFAIVGGLLLLFRFRYGFETNDQFQYLLLPYREMYEGFLTGDWFTWQTTHYHVTFSYIVRAVHAVAGEGGFAGAVFVLHLFVLTGIAYGFYRLARAAGWHLVSALIGLLIIGFVRHLGMGETVLNHGVLLPSDMALVPFLLAMASWIEKRPLTTGLFLGASGFLHANFAVLGPLVIAPLAIYGSVRRREVRQLVRLALGYLALAWPALVVIAKSFLVSDSVPGALDVLFSIRSPHHYNPDLLGTAAPWWLVALMVSGLPALLSKMKSDGAKCLVAFLLVFLCLQVVAGIGTVFQIHFLVRLFLWRLSIPLMLVAALAVGQSIVWANGTKKITAVLHGVSALILIGAFATKGYVRLGGEPDLGGWGGLIPGLILLVAAAVVARISQNRWATIVSASLSLLFLGLVTFITVPNPALLQKHAIRWKLAADRFTRFETVMIESRAIKGRNRETYRWIRENTPDDAIFLVPPGLDDFRMGARRGVYVDWKCCPMKGEEILTWKRRMLTVMGNDRFRARGYGLHRYGNRLYYLRPLKELADLARKEGLTHILHRSREDGTDVGLKKLDAKGPMTVYEVGSPVAF